MSLVQEFNNPPAPLPARLSRPQAAAYIGTTVRALERLAWLRRGPKYAKVGKRVYYRASELESWLLSLETKREQR